MKFIRYPIVGILRVKKGFNIKLFWTFKFSFDENILAFFGLATVWATFFKICAFPPNLLVTLGKAISNIQISMPKALKQMQLGCKD
jgi:hypothetical protein